MVDQKNELRPVRWNLRAQASGDLVGRCEAALHRLQTASSDEQLAVLADTRPLHRSLVFDVTPTDLPEAAGTYRGTVGGPLEHAERAVFLVRRLPGLRSRDACVAAARVLSAMEGLETRLRAIWHDRPNGDAAYPALAEVTQAFFHIHPYLDGNGHVLRLMLPVLAARLGLRRRETWTLHARPYDHHMSVCLQWYSDHPDLLACYLRKWFV